MEKIERHRGMHKLTNEKDVHELEVWARNGFICGIDEVGRGCLAGPVVTVAAILHPNTRSRLHLRDSKLMSSDQLIKAAKYIKKRCWWAYGMATPAEIDKYNIYRATQLAMKRATIQLCSVVSVLPERIVVDAMPLSFSGGILAETDIYSFTHGESRSVSIAAASILAKVKRDEIMARHGRLFEVYGFDAHVGYATEQHQEAVRQYGASIIHRDSFLKKLYAKMLEEHHEKQRELFS